MYYDSAQFSPAVQAYISQQENELGDIGPILGPVGVARYGALGQVLSPVGGSGTGYVGVDPANAARLVANLRASREAQAQTTTPTRTALPMPVVTHPGDIPFYDLARREMPTQMQIEAMLAYKRAEESAAAANGVMPEIPNAADVVNGGVSPAVMPGPGVALKEPGAAGVGIALAIAALFLLGG